MTEPKQIATVGVVIRTKDRPVFVLRALRSVAGQMFKDWRVALVNDGGDSAALDAALERADLPGTVHDRMIRLELTQGVGRSAAFNRGVRALETEFVTCLDDDDTWSPEFLSALVAFFRDTSRNVRELGGVLSRVTALTEELEDTPLGPKIRVVGEDDLPAAFKRSEFFVNPLAYACYRQDFYPVQWMLRRDAVQEIGGFPEAFDVMEDRAFMNLFLTRYRLAQLDRPLAYHHRRVQRGTDRERTIHLNTLDNPSYDWRFFADLARPGFDLAARAEDAQVLHSVAALLLTELNYETSAIWQKINGEMRALEARLDTTKKEILSTITAQCGQATEAGTTKVKAAPLGSGIARPRPDLTIPQDKRAYDLWQCVPGQDHAQHLAPGVRFAKRLELSYSGPQHGLLLHASPTLQCVQIQIPETRDWCAVEFALDDLALPECGLRCHLQLWSEEGYLFETALLHHAPLPEEPDRHMMDDFRVHACPAQETAGLTRDVDAAWLARVSKPKLSIVLPRYAQNFRFMCRNIMVEHTS